MILITLTAAWLSASSPCGSSHPRVCFKARPTDLPLRQWPLAVAFASDFLGRAFVFQTGQTGSIRAKLGTPWGVSSLGCRHGRRNCLQTAFEKNHAVSETTILKKTAIQQAQLIRDGEISSEELVRLTLERIHRFNPIFNAFVSVFDRAIETARRKDRERISRRGALPIFHGVPIGIKDLNVVRWSATRFGSQVIPPVPLPFDDYTVAPLRRAGFVILGKLATSEFGTMPVTEPAIHPPTRNPWSLEHSAGGSSGGSAAAVASGMLPVAQGSDGAGSIRIPAAFCNLYGLKPSRGRVRNQFGLPDRRVLYTSGPITHSVEDAAAMLDVMAGLVNGKPHWAPRPERLFSEPRPGAATRMKIQFVTRTALGPTHPDILKGFVRSLSVLSELGHHVEEGILPDGSLEEFLPLWQHQVAQLPLPRWSRTQPVTCWLGSAGRLLKSRDVTTLFDLLKARFEPAFATADIWVMPTVALPAPRIGAFRGLPAAEAFAGAAKLAAFTVLMNLVGLPAASVPMGFTRKGLPMGLQVVGRAFAEEDVLALSRQLEQAMPWRHRTPPL